MHTANITSIMHISTAIALFLSVNAIPVLGYDAPNIRGAGEVDTKKENLDVQLSTLVSSVSSDTSPQHVILIIL